MQVQGNGAYNVHGKDACSHEERMELTKRKSFSIPRRGGQRFEEIILSAVVLVREEDGGRLRHSGRWGVWRRMIPCVIF